MLAPLTPKQKEILEFITVYYQLNKISPSLEEVKQHFKLRAVSTVHEHIEKLKIKGYLKKEMNQARGIKTTFQTDLGDKFMEVNILGNIAAGKPIEAIEDPEPILINLNLLPGRGNFYALKVVGDSMIEDGIHDEDIVLIKAQNIANNGETVVAIVEDNRATLKKYYLEKDRIRLQPANINFKPMFYKKVEIRGKVVALIRKYS